MITGNRIRFTISLLDDLASSDDNNFCGMFANNALNVGILFYFEHSYNNSIVDL